VAAVTLPSIVSGPLLGAWLDRTSRRRTIMMLDQVLAASSLILIVTLAGHAPNWTVPLVALLAGATWPLSFGGFTSLIPVIVPDELLAQANALEATSFNFAVIGGPALAGTISAVADPAASLMTEAVLTLGAILLIARIPAMDAPIARHPGRSLVEIARDGLRHVAKTPPLRSVTAVGALNLGGIGLLTVAFPFFALDDLGVQRSVSGYLWAAFAFGSAIGAMTRDTLFNTFVFDHSFAPGANRRISIGAKTLSPVGEIVSVSTELEWLKYPGATDQERIDGIVSKVNRQADFLLMAVDGSKLLEWIYMNRFVPEINRKLLQAGEWTQISAAVPLYDDERIAVFRNERRRKAATQPERP